MRTWKVAFITLKEYHKRRHIYYILISCIIFTVGFDIGFRENPPQVDFVSEVAEGEVGFLCTLAAILLGMQTYYPKLKSGEIVLDMTKPVNRIDYFLGRFVANTIVCLFCAGEIVLYSVFVIYSHGALSQLILRASAALALPLFVLSAVSLLNLYLPAKATGISAFILYILYGSLVEMLLLNAAVVLLNAVILIVCGALLFNRKEL